MDKLSPYRALYYRIKPFDIEGDFLATIKFDFNRKRIFITESNRRHALKFKRFYSLLVFLENVYNILDEKKALTVLMKMQIECEYYQGVRVEKPLKEMIDVKCFAKFRKEMFVLDEYIIDKSHITSYDECYELLKNYILCASVDRINLRKYQFVMLHQNKINDYSHTTQVFKNIKKLGIDCKSLDTNLGVMYEALYFKEMPDINLLKLCCNVIEPKFVKIEPFRQLIQQSLLLKS